MISVLDRAHLAAALLLAALWPGQALAALALPLIDSSGQVVATRGGGPNPTLAAITPKIDGPFQ